MKITKRYLIPRSTDNETLFEDLGQNDFPFVIKPYNESEFEICIEVEEFREATLEGVMKWYL